jgi:Tfp pilus assembly protein PilN
MPNIFNMQMLLLLLLLLYADPERPKNNKATILSDSIQVLKDLNAEVNRLKAEYTSLSEESREVKLQLET